MEILENLWQCSEIFGFKIFGKTSGVFGNIRKFSENFGNDSKVFFRCFMSVGFSENLRKSSDIFGSEELKSFGAGF